MVIYFLRHASAGQKKLKNDEKRPLDKEGIEQCGYVGRMLTAMDVHVEMIASSPLKRAMQTASLVGNELGYEEKIKVESALRPNAGYDSFRELMRKSSKLETLMVVGHNPNLSRFLSLLISDAMNDDSVDLKKGSVAKVTLEDGRATLEWLLTPKIAKTAYLLSVASSRPKISRK
jgi:phosphohistidine phosphatase